MTRQHRQRRVAGLAIAVVAGLLTMLLPASMGTANAKPPPKPGTISDLTLSAAMPAASYRVTATWTAAPRATGYRVTLSNATGTLDEATVSTTAFIQAFAGGAILTMLANTMFPDAYRNGGREVGLVTVLGFIAGSGLVIASA